MQIKYKPMIFQHLSLERMTKMKRSTRRLMLTTRTWQESKLPFVLNVIFPITEQYELFFLIFILLLLTHMYKILFSIVQKDPFHDFSLVQNFFFCSRLTSCLAATGKNQESQTNSLESQTNSLKKLVARDPPVHHRPGNSGNSGKSIKPERKFFCLSVRIKA